PFEALRDASDRALARTGARPKVFLATLGALADFTARATFASNLYAAGGIEAVTSDGFGKLDDMVAAFKRSGGELACLWGADAVYVKDAAAAARALKTAGAIHISMAGRPRSREASDQEATLRAAGVETFIFVGCDVLATLKATHDMIGTTATG